MQREGEVGYASANGMIGRETLLAALLMKMEDVGQAREWRQERRGPCGVCVWGVLGHAGTEARHVVLFHER